jgi:autotransporter-associated beta strand protein
MTSSYYRFVRRGRLCCPLVLAAALLIPPFTAAAYDLSFDYTSFESTFGQAQFNVLNYPRMNGSYMNTSTDNHRAEMVANGNELAQFYNWLTDRYTEQTVKNGAAAADAIHQYTMNNSYSTQFNPPRPDWLVLNEISPSLWSGSGTNNATYRTWLVDCVTRLSQHYGYNVVTLAPFQEPAQNNASWQALSAVSYIGIECYLSGPEVWNSGSNYAVRLAWAEGEYADSKQAYINRGVPANKLFVTEHFASNNTHLESGLEVKWGRAGMESASDWDQVIMIRQDAIFNVGFDGFLAYNWGGNGMGITQAEQIQHEYYYRSRRVLASQKPQWLSDSAINVNGTVIPLSWNQPLNWLGGVPNAPGAEVNFWRTNTTNRTITLDGNKTAGELTFHSPFSYTISAGSGGSLILSNAPSDATLTSTQGSHTISAGVLLGVNLNADIATGTFTVSGPVSGPGGIDKTGAGTLALTNTNTYAGNTSVQGGTLRTNGPNFFDSADISILSGATLQLNFTGGPDAVGSFFIDGTEQFQGVWGPLGSGAEFTTPLLTGTGRLHVTTGPLAGDFNADGAIDAADYVFWRKQLGAPFTETHYNTWRSNYAEGDGGSGQGGDSVPSTVPEPLSVGLWFTGACALLLYWPDARRYRTARFS